MSTIEMPDAKISVLHVVVVALSLTMTIGAWLYSKRQVDVQIENRYEAAKEQTIGLIVDRMSRYEDALRSGVAHVASFQDETTLEDWRTFSDSLSLEERYPGVNGIGVIEFVERQELPAFMARRAAEGRDFKVHPKHDQEVLLPITFIEPEAMNSAAVGLDVAHETNRRTALLASRDTGTSQITGPIVLVQDSGHTPGFLFYAPFYKGETPTTVAERRAQFAGVVYAPFIVRKLVEGLLAKDLRNVRFSLSDGDTVIYDEHGPDEPLYDAKPMFQDSLPLPMFGRVWTVDIRTNLAFRKDSVSEQPNMILAGGLIIEILVITLLAMLARSNQRARNYAHELTRELREKSEHLEHANAEIEQFVYVASHDLKTPARGIGFLADVIEEDLEEVLGPLDDDHEIKMQLNMIRERVGRMNDLTQGIMEYSRVRNFGPGQELPLQIDAIIEDCVSDFDVDPAQIQTQSDIATVSYDSCNLRRVLENLIGNAFKYHPDQKNALINVSIETLEDRLKISVKDNGKGIPPEFHDRIFDVFQTLRRSGEPESTGIGLAIVKKAVQRHGFDIWINSAEGYGAEFTFYWPKDGTVTETLLESAA
ncbi:histidine kinase [Thioclava sp. SK-1]|uniref:CHASE domain-containing protein n=1 Tax=Thioclava sp. SK-1 TaxID=1889770 RepID=UPI000826A4BA|nr:CHASE domain-containing protein [Thioclava sp. SK-1]OCX60541.1 histidine kinase [Thioclava sp. SK-1]